VYGVEEYAIGVRKSCIVSSYGQVVVQPTLDTAQSCVFVVVNDTLSGDG